MKKRKIIYQINQVIKQLRDISDLYSRVPEIIKAYGMLLDELESGKNREHIDQILYGIFRIATDENDFVAELFDKKISYLNFEIEKFNKRCGLLK